ncbi:MAG: glycosyltransferase [Acidimicrobiales bacterium]
MRVLAAASMGGMGHLTPVLAAAEACRALGHEVTVLVPPAMAHQARRSGLRVVVGDEPPRAFVDDIWERLRAARPDPGLIDRELFADRATEAMLDAARAVQESFRPDLVVREPCEYSSAVAAHEAAASQAVVGISQAALERSVLDMVAPIIDRFAPGVADAIGEGPYLSSFPGSVDPSPWPDTRRFRRSEEVARPLPDWWPGDDRPLVYMTFGSVVGHLPDAAGYYEAALSVAASLPARVLVTVGRGTEVSELGPVPSNTHVEQWVPQGDVFACAAVVACHGGSGTTFGALEAGAPLVVCPFVADNSINGLVVQSAGAGVLVSGREEARGGFKAFGPADVVSLREAIETVLAEPSFRQAARSLAAEMRSMPTIDEVLAGVLSQP